ncbi:hypothetical protein F0562_013191 [Nyssa sinensis]|uniref:R3H domain-containing protein n=1 Tax=Nyssa sinensis TaxID=561372 RepID=A0A5J4ZXL6_9ASTE|nr:hypothetical protein F0562_013191 [Nyssa sinensis]
MFKAILVMGRDPTQFSKPPLDRLIPELLERDVKALDVCNAITHGVELVRYWQKLAQIAVSALEQRPIGEGQRGLGRPGGAAVAPPRITGTEPPESFRSLSSSVAKSWSAARQIQAMSSNLVAPRGGEATGLALPVYIMSTVLVFVMWALVAAIPCQERNGLTTNFQIPRQVGWAQAMIRLQERIAEEWKKKEKKGTAGLLEETQRMEKVALSLMEFADSFEFPAEEELVAAQVGELAEICRKMEEGLGPLEQQIRDVFRRIVKSRREVLDVLDQSAKLSSPVPY